MSDFATPDVVASLPQRQLGWTQQAPRLEDGAGAGIAMPAYPLSLTELLDRSCALYRRKFRSIIGLSAAIFFLPGLLTLRIFSTVLVRGAPSLSLINSSGSAGVGAIDTIVNMVAIFVLGVSVAPVVSAAYQGRPTPKALVRPLVAKLPAAVGGVLLAHSLLICALVVVPLSGLDRDIQSGIELALGTIALLFAPCVLRMAPALALERTNPAVALWRSVSLTRTSYWRSMGAIALGGVVTSVATYALSLIPLAALGALASRGVPYMWLPVGLINYAISALLQPIVALTACMIYFDARMRRDGYDVELLTERARNGR